MATEFVIVCFFATFFALFSNVDCTAGCHGFEIKNSKFKISGDDLFGKPEDVKFELSDCAMTLTEDLHIKEIHNLTVKYFIKKGAFKKEDEVDLCEGLENNSENGHLTCLIDILDTKSCPILEKPRRGSCDFSSEKVNMRLAKGRTDFKLEFHSERGDATVEGFVDIQSKRKNKRAIT